MPPSTTPTMSDSATPLDLASVRAQFPALQRRVDGQAAVYFDGPAGSQVPNVVIDAVADCLRDANANVCGQFATSRDVDQLLASAHAAAADFVGASDPGEVAFGANMTSLTFALSRALAKTWKAGDEIIVTHSDHDANVTPWVLAARDAGAVVRHAPIHNEDCTLDVEAYRNLLCDKTRLVALGCASNLSGTIHPIVDLTRAAHDVGAEVFLDAVHFAPHLPIDVAAWDCDYLACSAYKFFGPHVGMLWGRRERMETLPAYKVRPAPDDIPGRWMTGTANHEGIAGTLAAIDYIAGLVGDAPTRRAGLLKAFAAIEAYERPLALRLLAGLALLPDVRVWGITDPERIRERVPTITFTHAEHSPQHVARFLGDRGIFVWDGNYYALALADALGMGPEGAVRIGILHYNTAEEVDRLLAALRELSGA